MQTIGRNVPTALLVPIAPVTVSEHAAKSVPFFLICLHYARQSLFLLPIPIPNTRPAAAVAAVAPKLPARLSIFHIFALHNDR